MPTSKKPRKTYKKEKEPQDPLASIWDDVNDISNQIVATVEATVNSVKVSCSDLIIAHSTEQERTEIKTAVATINNDLKSVVSRRKALMEVHNNRTGGGTNPDDHAQALQIFGEYVQIMDLVETVVSPNVESLLNTSNKIIERHSKEVADDTTAKKPTDRSTTGISDGGNPQ